MKWTEQEIEYLREHYPNESNQDIALALHRNERSVKFKAGSFGLYKSDEYLYKKHSDMAKKLWANMTPESKEAMNKKRNKTLSKVAKASYDSERRRAIFGLEPNTKRRIGEHKTQVFARYRLLNVLNYFCSEGAKVPTTFYYDAETIRSPRMEDKYKKVFTFFPSDDYVEGEGRVVSYNRFVKNEFNQPGGKIAI